MKIKKLLLALCLAAVALVAAIVGLDPKWKRALPYPQAAPGLSASAEPSVLCFGHVDIEPGTQRLVPAQTGPITAVHVRMNQFVKAGTVLLQVQKQPALLRLEQARADLREAQNQQKDAARLPAQHQDRLAQQRAACEVAARRLAAARQKHARLVRLEKDNLINATDVRVAAEEVAAFRAAHLAAQHKLEEASRIDPSLASARARAQVDARQAQVALARHALSECDLLAPEDGTVLRVLASRGEVITTSAAGPAIVFAPCRPRIVRAEVNQTCVGRVKPGQAVVLEDDGDPSLTWDGTVEELSDWYTRRRSILQGPMEVNDVRTVECIIRPHRSEGLRIGQKLRVSIRLKGAGPPQPAERESPSLTGQSVAR